MTLKEKLFDKNNFLYRHFMNTQYIQKYLTQEEIAQIKLFPGKTLLEKMWNMSRDKDQVCICPNCNSRVPFNNWFAGGYGKCPKCNKDFSEKVIISKKQEKKLYTGIKSKRKIIEIINYDFESLFRYRNDNVKFHFICKECGKDVVTSYTTISHTKDWLCKACRKKRLKESH